MSAPLAALLTDMVNKRNYNRPRETKRTALQSRMIEAGINEGVAYALLKTSNFAVAKQRTAIEGCLEESLKMHDAMIAEFGDEFPMVRLEMLSVKACIGSLLSRVQANEGAENLREGFAALQRASRDLDKAVSKKALT